MAVTWNYENAAHLLRRCGFGGAPDDIQKFVDRHADVNSAVAELLDHKPSKKKPPPKKDQSFESKLKMQRWWVKTMAKTRSPGDQCREKLVLFWHNFLASGASKQPALAFMAYQNRLFRIFAKGNFRDLLREFNRDPANLYYLDGILNKIHPGEAMDKNLYDLPPAELAEVPTVCGSLREALEAVQADHEFLLKGDVFSKEQIDAYCELKWEEVSRWETTPSPVEYDMYYSA